MMMGGERYLLDTNICVFLLRGKFDISSHIVRVGIENCCISEITVAELLYGAECSSDVDGNLSSVKDFCNDIEIIPISESFEIYASQKARLRRQGLLIDDFDLLIGCAAIKYGMILVSDNTKHFDRLPINIENWVRR